MMVLICFVLGFLLLTFSYSFQLLHCYLHVFLLHATVPEQSPKKTESLLSTALIEIKY